MRAAAATALALAALAAGCGGVEPAPPPLDRQAASASGGVRVVDLTGAALVRPAALEPATDVALGALHWRAWGAAAATARGTARVHTCTPTCADGRDRVVPARVRLSGLRRCRAGRYYSRAAVSVRERGAWRRFASDLRAPC
jgi:hypothetical protein